MVQMVSIPRILRLTPSGGRPQIQKSAVSRSPRSDSKATKLVHHNSILNSAF